MVDLAAIALGITPELIEKDFWVTEALRVIASRKAPQIIFKGGTSLSKGFDLIRRMSEDIDILLYDTKAGSGKERESALRSLTKDVAVHLGITPIVPPEREEFGRKLCSRFVYTEKTLAIGSSGVLLELSYRGHSEPSVRLLLRSYIAEYAITRDDAKTLDYEELEGFELNLLAPERTLMEKIFALHVAASNVDDVRSAEELRRMARYYYDVKLLLDDDGVRAGILKLGDMETYSRTELLQAGIGQPFSGPARPPIGYAGSPAFDSRPEIMAIIADPYDAAMRFVFNGAAQPTLVECLETVSRYRTLL